MYGRNLKKIISYNFLNVFLFFSFIQPKQGDPFRLNLFGVQLRILSSSLISVPAFLLPPELDAIFQNIFSLTIMIAISLFCCFHFLFILEMSKVFTFTSHGIAGSKDMIW